MQESVSNVQYKLTANSIRSPMLLYLIEKLMRDIGDKIFTLPPQGKFHPKIAKIFVERKKAVESGTGIDWGTAEALAFASLIDEGNHVRLSG